MNWKDIIKIIFKGLGYTIAYYMGRGDAFKSIESHCNEEALKEATKTFEKREKIREKTSRLKRSIPNEWPNASKGDIPISTWPDVSTRVYKAKG